MESALVQRIWAIVILLIVIVEIVSCVCLYK